MFNILTDHRQRYTSIPISLVEYWNIPEPGRTVNCFIPHCHESMEMLSVIKGVLRVTCNGERIVLHPGEHVFFNPYDTHSGELEPEDEEPRWICMMLESKVCGIGDYHTSLNQILKEVRQGKSRFCTYYPAGEESDALTEVILDLYDSYRSFLAEQDAGGECLLMSGIFRLMAIMQKRVMETPRELLHNRDLRFIRQISTYVEEHYADPVDAASLCADLGYGERNFYRLFRQNFAMTFTEYLREYRIRCAAENYRGSELSVTEIAEAVGFTDYCYFSKTFKKYTGLPPSSYFRK